MKISKYTKAIKYNKLYYIYNSISNFLCETDNMLFDIIHKKQTNNLEIVFDDIDDIDTWKLLIDKNIVTDNDSDDILGVTSVFHKMRRISNTLNLTICPTLDCNFHCHYCFETKCPGIMDENVQDNILKMIENYKGIKHINITWFGGEPLLAPDVISNISKKLLDFDKITYSANILTNGYYLTLENMEMLEKCKVKSIQLTIDGISEIHNKKRFTKTDKDTFSTIINNIDTFHRSDYKMDIVLRVNIDSNNISQYILINEFFRKRYDSDNRIYISPAFILNTTKNNNMSAITDFDEKLKFWSNLAKYNGNKNYVYPSDQMFECATRNYNAWTVDPIGNLYKCWEIVGYNDYIVGKLTKDGINITNNKLLNRYLYGAYFLESGKCRNCFSLPICNGGCPHKRIENEFNNKNFNLCNYQESNLEKYIIERIKLEQT